MSSIYGNGITIIDFLHHFHNRYILDRKESCTPNNYEQPQDYADDGKPLGDSVFSTSIMQVTTVVRLESLYIHWNVEKMYEYESTMEW